MSKPRFGWWSYVKDMIRRYSALKEEYHDLHSTKTTACYSCELKGNDLLLFVLKYRR